MNTSTLSALLKVSAVLWIIWGLVHMLAGVMTILQITDGNIAGAVGGIADAVAPETLAANYPPAAGAVLGQHGFNLLWGGAVTLVCAFLIWRKNKHAIFMAALVGGLLDLGYFIFMDLGGYVHFVPGTLMTLISGSAIILSLTAYYKSDQMQQFA